MPQTAEDIQTIQGPDQKFYKVKKGNEKRFEQYFIKKGWVRKDGKWFTQTGEEAKLKVPSDTPKLTAGSGVPTPLGFPTGVRTELHNSRKDLPNKVTDYGSTALPSVLGGVGGAVGGPIGAGIGGAFGQGVANLMGHLDMTTIGHEPSTTQQMKSIAWEGVKQGGLDYIGGKAGDAFFGLLNKIPHVMVKDGIKFLPSEWKPNGTVSRYIEDLLSNLAPSAKIMEEFKAGRNKIILDKAQEVAESFSRINASSEELGMGLQKVMSTAEENLQKTVDASYKQYITKGFTPKQSTMFASRTAAAKELRETFENELAQKIIKTNKPELIAGFIRSKAAFADTRLLNKTIAELSPKLSGQVQNRIMRDIVQETLTGSKDPIAKGAQDLTKQFAGDKFKKVLDSVGEDKLKAIYGEEGYKRIEEFATLLGKVNTSRQGSGVGRFLNLLFIVPFRSGIKLDQMTKVGGTAFLLNRAAKFITSEDGLRLYENYIKASASQSPRLVNLAIEEIKKYNERSDAEFDQEQRDAQENYKRMDEAAKEKK